MSDDPLLELDTVVVRPTIIIDAKRYEILSPDELSVVESRRFSIWHRQLIELQQGEQDAPELTELVDMMSAKVLIGVPTDVFDKLSGVKRIAVVEVFSGLLLRSRGRVGGAIQKAMGSPQTGASSSLASPASMVDRRGNGLRKRLSAWFGRT